MSFDVSGIPSRCTGRLPIVRHVLHELASQLEEIGHRKGEAMLHGFATALQCVRDIGDIAIAARFAFDVGQQPPRHSHQRRFGPG